MHVYDIRKTMLRNIALKIVCEVHTYLKVLHLRYTVTILSAGLVSSVGSAATACVSYMRVQV